MAQHKIGRPTVSPKEIIIKVRIDNTVKTKLEYCSHKIGCSKSEILRLGIDKIYGQLLDGGIK